MHLFSMTLEEDRRMKHEVGAVGLAATAGYFLVTGAFAVPITIRGRHL